MLQLKAAAAPDEEKATVILWAKLKLHEIRLSLEYKMCAPRPFTEKEKEKEEVVVAAPKVSQKNDWIYLVVTVVRWSSAAEATATKTWGCGDTRTQFNPQRHKQEKIMSTK